MLAMVRITPITIQSTGVREASQAQAAQWLKEETHAARWGLLRGYSGKATKWVDFVVTDSTRREPCHEPKSSPEQTLRQEKIVENPQPR